MASLEYGDVSWERMIRAVEKVRQRVLRAASALEKAGIPYAVAGGNAVAAWVSRVDEAAVRNTQDVDVLLRRVPKGATRPIRLKLVPYYAWNNRDETEMTVSLPLR